MKIRAGFVSNSSSSSFIVTFPKKIETKEDLAEVMGECYTIDDYSTNLSTEAVIDRVWKDMENHTIQDLVEVYSNDYYDAVRKDAERLGIDVSWDGPNPFIHRNERNRRALQQVLEMPDYENIRIFEYGDTSDGALERGDIFRNVPHRKISNH